MTGLNPDADTILEIFCLITTPTLALLDDTGFHAVIQHDMSTLSLMDSWCTTTHSNSGLTARVLASTTTPSEAATSLLTYIQRYVSEPKTALLAGNSVHADKAFLRKEPYAKIMDFLHYRILDVSSIKEAAKIWSGEEILNGVPAKKGLHQAREDILESIEEARYYRDTIFQKPQCS